MSLTDSTEAFQRHGSLGANVDFDAVSIPGSVIERYRRQKDKGIGGDLTNFAGSTTSDTIYLIRNEGNGNTWRKWLVGPFCFLYMAGYISSYFTFTQYMYAKVQNDMFPNVNFSDSGGDCSVNKSSVVYQDQVKVQQHASSWSMYYGLTSGIPSIFANVIFGSSTDKFGRKFLFYFPCIGTFLRMAVSVVGIYTNFDLVYFIPGYIVEGMTGTMFTMLLVCFTYVADISPEKGKRRSFFITMIELAIGMAVSIFSFATGYFIENTGFFYPMLFAGIAICAAFVTAILIPETFPPEKRDTSDSSVWGKLKTAFELFFGTTNRGRRWMYNVLLLAFAASMFSVFGRSSVEQLYQLDEPFCWSSEKIGYFGALRGVVQQAVAMGLVKVLQVAMSDVSIAILGCASFILGNVVEGLARSDAMLFTGNLHTNLQLIPMSLIYYLNYVSIGDRKAFWYFKSSANIQNIQLRPDTFDDETFLLVLRKCIHTLVLYFQRL